MGANRQNQQYDAGDDFFELFSFAIKLLDTLSQWKDQTDSIYLLKKLIDNAEFLTSNYIHGTYFVVFTYENNYIHT